MTNAMNPRKIYSPRYLSQWFLWCRCPSFYIHKSRIIPKIPLSLVSRLLETPELARRNHYRLSQVLLTKKIDRLDMVDRVYFFLTMSRKNLDFICRLLAAFELGKRIRSTISGKDVQYLRKMLGDTILMFVTKRYNGFYAGSLEWQEMPLTDIETLLYPLGWSMLRLAGESLPEEFRYIWSLRLPQDTQVRTFEGLSSSQAYTLCLSILKELGI